MKQKGKEVFKATNGVDSAGVDKSGMGMVASDVVEELLNVLENEEKDE